MSSHFLILSHAVNRRCFTCKTYQYMLEYMKAIQKTTTYYFHYMTGNAAEV
jgi:hypothetical protein